MKLWLWSNLFIFTYVKMLKESNQNILNLAVTHEKMCLVDFENESFRGMLFLSVLIGEE